MDVSINGSFQVHEVSSFVLEMTHLWKYPSTYGEGNVHMIIPHIYIYIYGSTPMRDSLTNFMRDGVEPSLPYPLSPT